MKQNKTKQTGMRPRLSIAHGIQILMHYICQTEWRDVSLKVCINTYRQQRRHISSLWFLVSLFLIYSFPPHLHNLTRQLNALQQSWKSFHSEIFDLDFFFLLFVVNMDTLNSPKTITRQATTQERMREQERAWHAAETPQQRQERLTKRMERE